MNKNKLRIIETKICEHYNIDFSILFTGVKKRELSDKRHLFCFCARQIDAPPTHREISSYLHLRNTSSSVNSVRAWKNLLIYKRNRDITTAVLSQVKEEILKKEPYLF